MSLPIFLLNLCCSRAPNLWIYAAADLLSSSTLDDLARSLLFELYLAQQNHSFFLLSCQASFTQQLHLQDLCFVSLWRWTLPFLEWVCLDQIFLIYFAGTWNKVQNWPNPHFWWLLAHDPISKTACLLSFIEPLGQSTFYLKLNLWSLRAFFQLSCSLDFWSISIDLFRYWNFYEKCFHGRWRQRYDCGYLSNF